MKVGVVKMVDGIRTELNNNPAEGVDTVYVNKVADAFLARLENDQVKMEAMGQLAQSVQAIMSDQVVDGEEAHQFIDIMIEYYPELGDLAPSDEVMGDTLPVADSLEQTE